MPQGGEEPPDAGGNADEGPILSPEELDISEDDHVRELEDGRYVVSPDGPISDPVPSPPDGREAAGPTRAGPSGPEASAATLDQDAVHDWLARSFEDTTSRYGFDVTATFDGRVAQRRMASNDVTTIFESLILWYAQQIETDTPVEEVLGILLMESTVPIRYPPASLERLVATTDLEPGDSIADLLAAVEADDGVSL